MKTILYTCLALLAFAGNSVLCRLALGDNTIDAASFTAIRLLSGIVVLFLIIKLKHSSDESQARGSWTAALFLFSYATSFSYAYLSLDTGIGALVLFVTVQISMITMGLFSGHKLNTIEWWGIFLASFGFIYLMLPSLTTPSLIGFILMSISGVAWAGYTLIGKSSINPLLDTAYNFLRTFPLIITLILVSLKDNYIMTTGIYMAILSGGLASAIGYTFWYMALKELSSVHASVVQLLVPIIATAGGIIFSAEIITPRFVISTLIILSGILMVTTGQYLWKYIYSKKLHKKSRH
jgi:drug/metabolite transporter (DMT)-like permease